MGRVYWATYVLGRRDEAVPPLVGGGPSAGAAFTVVEPVGRLGQGGGRIQLRTSAPQSLVVVVGRDRCWSSGYLTRIVKADSAESRIAGFSRPCVEDSVRHRFEALPRR